MSNLPQPKYKIGDTVYTASVNTKDVAGADTCPDCLGSQKWQVTLASGETFNVPCERCNRTYGNAATFVRKTFIPTVNSLCIASIKAGTHMGWSNEKNPDVEYMSNPGGGSVILESKCFETHDAAMSAAKLKAKAEEAKYLASESGDKERMRRNISTYVLTRAIAADLENKERESRYKYEAAIECICDMPEAYLDSGDSKVDESQRVIIARHLLKELGEDEPSEWEAKYG